MGRHPKDGPALCARFFCVAEMNAIAPISDKLAALAAAEAALIDNYDTVDARAATGSRATEFVGQ